MSIILVGGLEPSGEAGLAFHRGLLKRADDAKNILHIPAARHDAPSRQAEFRLAYEGALACHVETLELHRRRPPRVEVLASLEWADLVFLDGGNSAWLMEALDAAHLAPLLQGFAQGSKWLLGFSAGANCLHEQGWSAAAGQRPVPGLGILPGGFAPHGSNPGRSKALQTHLAQRCERWLVCADGSAVALQAGSYEILGSGVEVHDHREGSLQIIPLEPGHRGPTDELYRTR